LGFYRIGTDDSIKESALRAFWGNTTVSDYLPFGLMPSFMKTTFQFRRNPPSLEARREDSALKSLGQGQERGDV